MKPKPLFVGGSSNHTNEAVVKAYAESLSAEYRRGEHWGEWSIGGIACWVTLVSVGPADWRYAVFEDGPAFRI